MNTLNALTNVDSTTLALIALLAGYTVAIKGFALYRAGSLKDKGWFIALLLINSLGLLELVYLFAISKRKK